MANNNDGQIVLGLDIPKTVSQINDDIKKLQSQLDQVKATGALDTSATVKQINAQIATLQAQLNNINIQANVNMNNSTKTSAQQTGQQIGKLISDSAEQAISRVSSPAIGRYFKIDPSTSNQFRTEMEKLVSEWTNAKGKLTDINIQTRTSYDKDADENITRLHQATVTYKNELDEVIKKTIAWRQIGTTTNAKGEEQVLRGFVEVAGQYSKSIDTITAKTDTFVDKQKKAVGSLTSTLASIKSGYDDKNASKPIKLQSNIDKLEEQYAKVETAIKAVGQANKSTFTDAEVEANRLISELRDMVKEYRNAENVSTKMKGTDFTSGLSIAKNDLEKFKADAKDFPQITQTIKDLDTAIGKVGDASSLNKFNDELRVARSELAKIKSETSATNKTEKVGINTSGLQSKIADLQKISPEIDKFETEINGAKVTVQSLLTDLSKINTQGDFSVVNAKFNAFTKAAEASGIAIRDFGNVTDSIAEKVNKIQLSLDDKSYEVQIAKLKEGFVKLSGDANEAEKQIKDVRDAYQELVNANGNDKILAEEKFLNVLSREQNQLKINQSEAKEYIDTFKLAKLKNDIETWLKNNTAATKEAKDAMRLYLDEINRGNITPFREKEIRSGMGSITNDMRQMNKLGKSTIETFKQGAKSFLEWTTASGAVMEVWNAVRQGIDELKDLDDILTEISKTSDLTEQQLKKLGDTAFESASKYGKSASDYLTGVQEMYRAGFDNASEMAELSVLAQSAGDMETNLANDYLLATNAAYKYKGSIEELNKVLDSQNYITNNAAISMKDIADATTETASVAAQYGVQIDELSALIATATANTRESGSEVGTALKAILINLQDTTSKPVTETFDALGISMTKVVNGAETLKTPIELIHELSDAYNSLPEGDVMRANILNEIGQKRHANTLASILSDMESYHSMLDLYNNSSAENSAFREAQKSAENWSGTWNKVKNSWSDLLQNFANTDTIVGALNILNDLIGTLDKLGAMGTIGLGAGLFAGIKNVGEGKMHPSICFE